jgi:hypothetical protein
MRLGRSRLLGRLPRYGMIAVSIGIVVGFVVPAAAEGGPSGRLLSTNVQLPEPGQSFREAARAAPYPLKVPQQLPSGTRTLLVSWVAADPGETGSTVNVDMWYETAQGERIHIWQTNSQTLLTSGMDPAAPTVGAPVLLGESLWQEASFTSGTTDMVQLARRFPDGVTVSLDSSLQLGLETLRGIAASIQ